MAAGHDTARARPGRRRRLLTLSLASTTLAVAPVSTAVGVAEGGEPAAATADGSGGRSIGYLSYWDQQRGIQSLTAADGGVTEVSPSWYSLDALGNVVVQEEGRVDDSPEVVDVLRAEGALVVPAIANYRNKRWDSVTVSEVLADPATRLRHVEAIVRLVTARGFDGIDIDYEHLQGSDRSNFSTFVSTLAVAMHQRGRLLSVTVHPKTWEPGPQGKNQAQDYAAIGGAADEVRIMLYDYHWDTSEPGPLAPIRWVRSVMEFAATQVPPRKLVLGLATYGYDWVGSRGRSLMWREIRQLRRRYDAEPRWSTRHKAPWFTYVDDRGRPHTVWYENARSLRAKAAVVSELGLAGAHYWRLGGNDPRIWR